MPRVGRFGKSAAGWRVLRVGRRSGIHGYGVSDGHVSPLCSSYVHAHFTDFLNRLDGVDGDRGTLFTAIERAVGELHASWLAWPQRDDSGTTLTVLLLKEGWSCGVLVNVGDSPFIVHPPQGTPYVMTTTHNFGSVSEYQRVMQKDSKGMSYVAGWRYKGRSVSRAIGDASGQPQLFPKPDIKEVYFQAGSTYVLRTDFLDQDAPDVSFEAEHLMLDGRASAAQLVQRARQHRTPAYEDCSVWVIGAAVQPVVLQQAPQPQNRVQIAFMRRFTSESAAAEWFKELASMGALCRTELTPWNSVLAGCYDLSEGMSAGWLGELEKLGTRWPDGKYILCSALCTCLTAVGPMPSAMTGRMYTSATAAFAHGEKVPCAAVKGVELKELKSTIVHGECAGVVQKAGEPMMRVVLATKGKANRFVRNRWISLEEDKGDGSVYVLWGTKEGKCKPTERLRSSTCLGEVCRDFGEYFSGEYTTNIVHAPEAFDMHGRKGICLGSDCSETEAEGAKRARSDSTDAKRARVDHVGADAAAGVPYRQGHGTAVSDYLELECCLIVVRSVFIFPCASLAQGARGDVK
jgi:hypothetical protein